MCTIIGATAASDERERFGSDVGISPALEDRGRLAGIPVDLGFGQKNAGGTPTVPGQGRAGAGECREEQGWL
jgi:hypothetical protein